jgi:hypothetical protein
MTNGDTGPDVLCHNATTDFKKKHRGLLTKLQECVIFILA